MTKAELLKALAEKRAAAGGKACWMSVDSEASLYVHISSVGQDRFYYRTKKIVRRVGKVSDLSLGIRCHTTFRHPFNFSWSGKTCDIRRSSKTTS